jgi:hypothetical protein
MANKLLLKKSNVAAKVPLTSDLAYGEIALNYQDGRLYFKTAGNAIDYFSSGAASTPTLQAVTGIGATTSIASTFSGGLTVGGTGVVYNGSTSGAITLKSTAVAGTNVITLPAATGTVALTSDIIAQKKQEYTATAAQTTFTVTNGYTVGTVQVFANGIALAAADYTATTGTTVVLTEARVVGDNIIILCFGTGSGGSGSGGTTTNALTVSTGLALNSGTTFDGSAAKTLSLASIWGSNQSAGGSLQYISNLTFDIYGRMTGMGSSYLPGTNSFSSIYVNGNPATSASGYETLNFVGSGATTVAYSSGAYKTITISSTASAGGGSAGWYSMIATQTSGTTLPVPTAYDGSNSNMAYVKLFVGGDDASYPNGSQPITGMWSSYSGSGINTYSNSDSSPGYSGSTIAFYTTSGGVRFAIAPKWVSPTSGSISYSGVSSYSGGTFNSMNGWMGPPGYYSNKAWFGIVVVDTTGITATAVNCTVHQTMSSSYKTYFAISMTDAQCSTVSNSSGAVCTFSSNVLMRSYGYYTYG